jgi:hypothetical protein
MAERKLKAKFGEPMQLLPKSAGESKMKAKVHNIDRDGSLGYNERVNIRRHFYEQHSPSELVDFLKGKRGPVDDEGRAAIAKLLFGENATIEDAMKIIDGAE